MSSYFSMVFYALFLPLLGLAYMVVPRRVRPVVLLLASYTFIWVLSSWLTIFVAISTLSVYAVALRMDALHKAREQELSQAARSDKKAIRERYRHATRRWLVVGILVNVGILYALKYLGFGRSLVQMLMGATDVQVQHGLGIGAPLGISFYTFMAVSYLVDVCRQKTKASTNLLQVALYLSFLPVAMEGPICRFDQTAPALMKGDPINGEGLYRGVLRMSLGFVKKLIVADRLDPLVGEVFGDFGPYEGGVILAAAVLYTIQLYCDFSGCMDVAIGMGNIFNVNLPENFRQPFFSKTTSEFWQRWHITLGAWFKDYLYYPIALSKWGKAFTKWGRKHLGRQVGPAMASSVALFAVWVCNGVWHGAGTQYLLFGLYYFVLIFLGGFVEIAAVSLSERMGINRESLPYVVMRVLRTICFVVVGELIFRSTDGAAALAMIGKLFTNFVPASLTNGKLLHLGLNMQDLQVVAVTMVLVFGLDALKERGVPVADALASKGSFVRWLVPLALAVAVLVFGAYGHGYVAVNPMYAEF